MVTGDSILTALHTARACALIGPINEKENHSQNEMKNDDKNENKIEGDDKGSGSDVDDSVKYSDAIKSSSISESRNHDTDSVLLLSIRHQTRSMRNLSENPYSDVSGIERTSTDLQQINGRKKRRRSVLVWTDLKGKIKFEYKSERKKPEPTKKNKKGNKDATQIPSHILKKRRVNIIDEVDEEREGECLVGMSARELSEIGGYDLGTSGEVINYITTGVTDDNQKKMTKKKGNKNNAITRSAVLNELKYFKVKLNEFILT